MNQNLGRITQSIITILESGFLYDIHPFKRICLICYSLKSNFRLKSYLTLNKSSHFQDFIGNVALKCTQQNSKHNQTLNHRKKIVN